MGEGRRRVRGEAVENNHHLGGDESDGVRLASCQVTRKHTHPPPGLHDSGRLCLSSMIVAPRQRCTRCDWFFN